MSPRRTLRLLAKDRESGWTFALPACLVYMAFLVWMHAHHEMWRDEIHPWTLARLANGFWDLVTGDRVYEGHPPLWFWYLRVWTWFTTSAWGIQAATVAAATAAAALLLRFAPFPRYLKLLILFSYYFGFEYTVMTRNYVLGWLCICLFCTLYHPLRARYFWLAISLALMALTSFYGMAMSACLLLYFLLDHTRFSWSRRSAPAEFAVSASPRSLITLSIVSATLVFGAFILEPPDPNPFAPAFNFDAVKWSAIPEMLYRVAAAFLPWRTYSLNHFWLSAFTFWEIRVGWASWTGGAVLLVALLALYPSWRLILIYLTALAGMLVFQQVRMDGTPRHWGHFLILFLAACWLLRKGHPRRKHRLSTVYLTGLFALQLHGFVIATVLDTREVFSGGRETAAFIRRENLQDLPIVAGPDFAAIAFAGYLRRPFLAAETEEVNETVVYHGRRRGYSPAETMNRAIAVSRDQHSPVVLVVTTSLPDPPSGVTRTFLFKSRPAIITDEVFSVYRLKWEP
jgi:hypothetical protein